MFLGIISQILSLSQKTLSIPLYWVKVWSSENGLLF